MYLRFDHKSLSMDMLVGVREAYQPNEEAAKLYDRVEALRNKSNQFVKDNFGDMKMEEIAKILESDKDKKATWDNYVNNDYAIELKGIIESVKALNESFQKKEA